MRVWCRRRPFWWLFLAPSLAISSHEESVEVTEQGETSFLADDALMNESSDKENKAVSDGPGSKFGVVQRMGLEDERRDVTVRLELSQSYMESVVGVDKSYDDVRGLCRNNDSWCTIWAIRGECERNPSFMHVDCAPACFACEKLRVTDPCAIDPNVPDALYAGGLDDLFERIAADPALQIYEPKVWSRPYYAVGDGPEHADYQLGLWLVTFENILNQEEADRIINWGLALGYHPSLAEVGFNEDGSSIDGYHENRTSSNTWCANGCDTDPVVVEIGRRIEHITGIPTENAEHLQLLRYEEGQKYDVRIACASDGRQAETRIAQRFAHVHTGAH